MHRFLLFFLAFFARMIIQIHRPYVIGVSGTIGKTTVSTYIARYLSTHFPPRDVSISEYHYNGEYGLPLSIIGVKTGGKNPFRWMWVFLVACVRMVTPYPKYLILEYGIDHPGEMEWLLDIVIPDIAILTPVAPNHIEQFGTFEQYRRAKLFFLKHGKTCIAHESLRTYISEPCIYYGFGGMSDIDASHIELSVAAVSAQVHVYDRTYPVTLKSFGEYQIENILPVFGVASILELDLSHIPEQTHLFVPEAGRSNILSGIEDSIIIDGTYNGGYESIVSGIRSLAGSAHARPIVLFLGDMRELGDDAKELHEKLARTIVEIFASASDVSLFLVGPLMQEYVAPIVSRVFSTHTSLSSRELGRMIRQQIGKKKGTQVIIYAKGSQNTIFIEEGLKSLLSDPTQEKFLTRQSKLWIRKKERYFSSLEN